MSRVVALVPAYNEASSIADTLGALLGQTRVPDLIVAIPNGCTDNTADIARTFPVTVMELPRLQHKKSEALNRAWHAHARDADVVICLDADTVLPPNAVADWEKELTGNPTLAGSSSKFTMLTDYQKGQPWYAKLLTSDSCPDPTHIPFAEVSPQATTGLIGATSKSSEEGGAKGSPTLTESPGSTTSERYLKDCSSVTSVTNETALQLSTSSSGRQPRIPQIWSKRDGLRGESGPPATSSMNQMSDISRHHPTEAVTSQKSSASLDPRSAKSATDVDGLGLPASTPPLRDGRGSQSLSSRWGGYLTRLQKSEFSQWCDCALRRGYTTVLAGTGCAISGKALREVVADTGQDGPWSYKSLVEDWLLTYDIRRLGYRCHVSPTVRAYTDSMKTTRSLLAQRMKWQTGTVEDLLSIGINRLTLVDWWQQAAGLAMAGVRVLWVALLVALAATDTLVFSTWWWVAVPLLFAAGQGLLSLRIPHRDWKDTALAVAIIPGEHFAWLRSYWFIIGWAKAIKSHITGVQEDLWTAQAAAETA